MKIEFEWSQKQRQKALRTPESVAVLRKRILEALDQIEVDEARRRCYRQLERGF